MSDAALSLISRSYEQSTKPRRFSVYSISDIGILNLMTLIRTARDLRSYVCTVAPAGFGLENSEIDAVTTALVNADHPAYGTDWADWLDENAERIGLAAVGA